MAESLSVPIRFLEDRGLVAAQKMGVFHEQGTPAGMVGFASDTIMPTVLITDAEGKIHYSDLTSNYRVRPEPDAFITELEVMLS